MAFDVYGAGTSDNADKATVDFDALNRYVVETAGLQERETLNGVISMIVDLGNQNLEDAEATFTGTAAEEVEIIAKQPDTYFKDGIDSESKKPIRLKCWPQKPQQCVAMAVDFPDIILDKGAFFGNSDPLPLRMWLGGQFYIPTRGMVIGRPTTLKYTNLDKTRATKVWSLAQNSLPYKMAVAAKLIKAGEPFLPDRIDELLGQAFQFTVQLHMKPGKAGKEYYTEYVNFAAALGRGIGAPELPFEPMLIQFMQDNDPKAIKDLRAHVVNTIKGANNYEGSKIKEQIEAVRGVKPAATEGATEATPAKATAAVVTPAKPKATPKPKPAPVVPPKAETAVDFDDDIPF